VATEYPIYKSSQPMPLQLLPSTPRSNHSQYILGAPAHKHQAIPMPTQASLNMTLATHIRNHSKYPPPCYINMMPDVKVIRYSVRHPLPTLCRRVHLNPDKMKEEVVGKRSSMYKNTRLYEGEWVSCRMVTDMICSIDHQVKEIHVMLVVRIMKCFFESNAAQPCQVL